MMKDKEIASSLIGVTLAAMFVGILLSTLIIRGAHSTSIATAPQIPSSFPDVKNDSRYSSFLNANALDPTQAVSVGSTQNSSPFNSQTGQ